VSADPLWLTSRKVPCTFVEDKTGCETYLIGPYAFLKLEIPL
jgi:hypothetical protein